MINKMVIRIYILHKKAEITEKISFESYKKNEELLEQKFPEQKMLFRNYAIIEYLAILVAMTRNDVYNKRMQKGIQRTVRSGLPELLKATYIDRKFKVSAVAVGINTGLFGFLYKLVERWH